MSSVNDISNRTIFRILAMILAFIALAEVTYLLRHQLEWLGMAFFLAVAINPAVEWFARRMPRKSRGLATGLVFLLTISLLVFMALTLIPPMVSQTKTLISNLPDLANQLQNSNTPIADLAKRYDLIPLIKSNQDKITSGLSSLGGSAFDLVKGAFSSVVSTLSVLALTFFMLLEGPNWIKIIRRMQNPDKLKHREELVGQMYKAVTGYVNGNLFTSLIAAATASAMLAIVGIPFAIPLGLVVGIFDLLPLVGATLAAIIVVTICLFTSVTSALIMLLFFLLYQQIENHVLQPVVYSRTVQLSPLTVLVAGLLGASLAGLAGALVAIPIAASVQIVGKDYFYNHRRG